MRRRLYVLCMMLVAAIGWLTARSYSVDEIPNVQVQDRTKHLSNPDGIISPAVATQIDSLLMDARRRSTAEIVAVVVDDVNDDIDDFATTLINKWGVGKRDKNNGILLLVARDGRAATIRTGYGAEGVMPDIIAGRIVYDTMIPHFKEGDFDGGVLAGVQEIHRLVTDPQAMDELRSQIADEEAVRDKAMLHTYFTIAGIVAIVSLIWLCLVLYRVNDKTRGLSDYQKYRQLGKYTLPLWVISLIFIGIPILAPVILWLIRRHLRNHPRKCPHCHAQMQKLSEEEDNKYLTYAQDLEERIKSVDYDVWLCPKCGEKDIYSFVNKSSNYKECQLCHAHTVKLTGTRIIQEPTTRREGIGEKQYVCLNCQNRATERYRIPKKEPPVVIVPSGGGGRGFGGGSFGGGFGGGLSGGGGATGRW